MVSKGFRGQGLTKHVENEANEAMVDRERQEDLVDDDNVLEVVDDGLAVQEIHGGREPVPVEALGGAEGAGARGDVGDGDDLLEGDDLDGGDDEDDVDVADEEGGEEDADHDEGPDGARPEVCLLLLVLGLFVLLGLGLLQMLLSANLEMSEGVDCSSWLEQTYLLHGLELCAMCVGRSILAGFAEARPAPVAARGPVGLVLEANSFPRSCPGHCV